MKAIDFKQANIKIAEHQEEYQTLPADYDAVGGTVTVCFELDLVEKKQVAEDGRIYLTIHTMGQPLHPIGPTVLSPYKP